MQIKGFINYRPASYPGEKEFAFHAFEMRDFGYVTVMPFAIEVEIPAGFDPRANLVEALQEKKREVMAEFGKRITQLDEQINKYLALEAT